MTKKPAFEFEIPSESSYFGTCPTGCPFAGVDGHEDLRCNLGLGSDTYHGDAPGPNCPGPGRFAAFKRLRRLRWRKAV